MGPEGQWQVSGEGLWTGGVLWTASAPQVGIDLHSFGIKIIKTYRLVLILYYFLCSRLPVIL